MTADLRTPPPRAERGPVRATERALAPDLARGAMLVFIALANAAGYFLASTPGVETNPQGFERYFNVFMVEFVHARAFPLFAIMFGYGLVQLSRRQATAGASPKQVRSVLIRRNAWLIVFGALHGILLYSGDFLGAYGIIGIAFTLIMLQRSEKVQRFAPWYMAIALVYTLVFATITALSWNSGGPGSTDPSPFKSAEADTYASSVLERLAEWPAHTATLLAMILMVWVGSWAARHRILEEPQRHLRLLGWAAVGGVTIAVTAGLPMALSTGGFVEIGADAVWPARMLYETSGFFGGVGYVALFGLLTHAITRRHARPGLAVTAVSALGQRSLTGYLLQSVAWLILASPFTLALDQRVSSPILFSALCAIAVWLVTVVASYAMHRAGYRGPAETLLRRLTYGRR